MPWHLSPVTISTPESPRSLSHRRNSLHESFDSVNPSAQPMISRRPSPSTPMAARMLTFS